MKLYSNLLFQLLLCVLLPGTVPITHIEKISNVLYRGPEPNKRELHKLKDMGIKTIVSCRTNPERATAVDARQLGIDFIHIPTGVFIRPGPRQINRFLEIARDPSRQPVYLSCVLGFDRISVYAGVYRVVEQHYSYEQALADMKKNHLKLWWYAFRGYKKVIREYVDNPSLADEKFSETDVAARKSQ